ncbi:GNAT family N-acetyltransferase [Roseibium porphyridii]|uniref:GNAT family N-acetyltransferase n=1 Tax=Roseibium porphyridii TaxID=2866279 RepID=A0ABY8F2J7_9HYPH|nr:GNAT family N-acetyltransferase [Roseibium sp. KMA01]WFE89451.1 GNAT family N-acetyltransferase [Roseibium sp. KMA01]
MKLPSMRTGRLSLRPVLEKDLSDLVRLIDDYDVAKMLTTVPHPYALSDARDWHGQTAVEGRDGERAFAIDKGQGLIGVVSCGKPDGTPEFGYWLARRYWGQGIMTEAGKAVLAWHFDCSPGAPVLSGALDENRASLNVLTKLGFTEIGPYRLSIRSRGETLPATRMKLEPEAFERMREGNHERG